jgi:hypothetical protein
MPLCQRTGLERILKKLKLVVYMRILILEKDKIKSSQDRAGNAADPASDLSF